MLWIIIAILIGVCFWQILGLGIILGIMLALVLGIRALVLYFTGGEDSDGKIFFNILYVVVGILGFICFCIKCKND